MTRIQAASYALIASACVLAGLLLARVGSPLDTPAQAEMLLNRGDFTMMTASTRDSEESLFILDGRSQQLLIYTGDVNNNTIDLEQVIPMSQMFGRSIQGGGGTGR